MTVTDAASVPVTPAEHAKTCPACQDGEECGERAAITAAWRRGLRESGQAATAGPVR